MMSACWGALVRLKGRNWPKPDLDRSPHRAHTGGTGVGLLAGPELAVELAHQPCSPPVIAYSRLSPTSRITQPHRARMGRHRRRTFLRDAPQRRCCHVSSFRYSYCTFPSIVLSLALGVLLDLHASQ